MERVRIAFVRQRPLLDRERCSADQQRQPAGRLRRVADLERVVASGHVSQPQQRARPHRLAGRRRNGEP